MSMTTPVSLSMPSLGGLFDRDRIRLYCGILLAAEIAVFLFMVAGTHGLIVPLPKPTSTDFVSFYAAGSLANAGTPQLAYDKAEHYAAEQRATQVGIDYNFFYYPPTFLLLCAAITHLPYIVAFLIFEMATLCFYLLVARRILDDRAAAILVPLLAFPPVLWTFGLGQNAFLTAGLFGSATLLVDRRPAVAGALFGALCYKPHFALLVPVALAAGGRWRALVATFASAAGLCLLSSTIFGWEVWRDFLTAAVASPAVYQSGRISLSGFINPFGAVLLLGGNSTMAYGAQAVTILAAALVVAYVWYQDLPLPIRAATLASATLAALPVALFYDLMLAAIAAAWLLRADGKYRLAEWEKVVLACLFFLTLDPRSLSEISHLPIGPLVTLGFAAFVVTHVVRVNAIVAARPKWSLCTRSRSLPVHPRTSNKSPTTRSREPYDYLRAPTPITNSYRLFNRIEPDYPETNLVGKPMGDQQNGCGRSVNRFETEP
jgi:alpha-1,2-mannosyltransferase